MELVLIPILLFFPKLQSLFSFWDIWEILKKTSSLLFICNNPSDSNYYHLLYFKQNWGSWCWDGVQLAQGDSEEILDLGGKKSPMIPHEGDQALEQ